MFADETLPVAVVGAIALVAVAFISAYGAIKVAKIARVVQRVEVQTNSRLTKLLGAVALMGIHIDEGDSPLSDAETAQVSDALGEPRGHPLHGEP